MSPIQAVKSVFRQYVGFSGRARRSEYWWFWLFAIVVSIVAAILDGLLFGFDESSAAPITIVVALAMALPSIAVTIRRLHDTDRSGWWYFIGLVPIIGGIVLFVFYVTDSKPDNRFGPSPKGSTQAVTV